jgi:Do/DeqQ family serine protease
MIRLRERFSLLAILLVSFLMGGMFVFGGFTAYKYIFPDNSAQADLQAGDIKIGPDGIAETVKQVSPAVVYIETEIVERSGIENNPFFSDPFFRDFFGDGYRLKPRPQISRGMGTGIITDKSGLILTNEHVIHGASKITVKLEGSDEPVPAEVVGADPELDLAVLRVKSKKDLPTLKLGDSDKINAGNWVIAIGNPYGLDHTVTVGVISAKGRGPVTIGNRQFKNLLQTDAAINPGNSGGPLMNVKGEVIGINTAVNAQAQGIGFAIPINTVKSVLEELVTKGKVVRPYMGVYLQPLDKELAAYLNAPGTDGALVADVSPGGPAEKAGLKKGDIILKINGKKVPTPDDLSGEVKKSKVGIKLVLEILREGKTKSVTLTLAEKPVSAP